MMKYENCYGVILGGEETESDGCAIDFASGFVFSELESSTQNIAYGRYIDTVEGIDIYYDFGADYYFFCDTDK